MIALVNVFLTKKAGSVHDRGRLAGLDAAEIFRVMLMSLRDLPATRYYIFVEIDRDSYSTKDVDGLAAEAYSALAGRQVVFRSARLCALRDWQRFLDSELLPLNECIFYAGNHDHVFIDRDSDVLNLGIAELSALRETHGRVGFQYSHWQEHFALRPRPVRTGAFGFISTTRYRDALQIVTPELLREWFFADPRNLSPFMAVRRTEDLGWEADRAFTKITPARELFRHADAYSHAGISLRNTPPLAIPSGLLDRNLRIAVLAEPDLDALRRFRAKGYCCVSPWFESIAVEQDGVDFHWLPDDIPKWLRAEAVEVVTHGDVGATAQDARCARYVQMLADVHPIDAPTLDRLSAGHLRGRSSGPPPRMRGRPHGERRSESFAQIRTPVERLGATVLMLGRTGYCECPEFWAHLCPDEVTFSYVWVRERKQIAHIVPMQACQFSNDRPERFRGLLLYEFDWCPNMVAALRRAMTGAVTDNVVIVSEAFATQNPQFANILKCDWARSATIFIDVKQPSRPTIAMSIDCERLRTLIERQIPDLFEEDELGLCDTLLDAAGLDAMGAPFQVVEVR